MKTKTTKNKISFVLIALYYFFVLTGCRGKADKQISVENTAPKPSVKEFEQVSITGAGATFPYPVYSKWAFKFNQLTGLSLNYQSIGSGGGIAQIKAKTVDFGASDAPLTKEELDANGLVQFPMVIGGVVPVINIEGIKDKELKLTPDALAGIFLGKIKKWNDPILRELNPALKLPDKDINVVHRADGSGTTWLFTNYLSKVSSEWNQKVGCEKAVSWTVGVGGKGNEGVTAYVQKLEGSIGYVEFAYALQNNMTTVMLRNRSDEFVSPSIESFQSAASNADWKNTPGFAVVLTDQPGKGSWPITGASFILIHKNQTDRVKADAMLKFFDWCYRHGEELARELHYVPIPQDVVSLIENSWRSDIISGGEKVWK